MTTLTFVVKSCQNTSLGAFIVRVIVAGRSAQRVRAVAHRYGFEHRVFGLDDPETLVAGLADVGVVLHCAGPFSRTSKPMIDACLAARAHYLDITGEIAVFESAAARDADARSAGVMLLPGTGFDIVPSDCLALHVARKLADVHELTLGFFGLGSVSHGTAMTIVENVHRGGFVRRDGKLTPVPTGSLVRDIDYGDGSGKKRSMAIPWGDVSTAFHSTRIPNIEVYVPATSAMKRALAGQVEKGFSTPAKLLGPDFILGFEAVRRRDDEVA
ncbi:MAG: saccharopine dehydrogenase family protein [Gammaproteobacteria bacterium]